MFIHTTSLLWVSMCQYDLTYRTYQFKQPEGTKMLLLGSDVMYHCGGLEVQTQYKVMICINACSETWTRVNSTPVVNDILAELRAKDCCWTQMMQRHFAIPLVMLRHAADPPPALQYGTDVIHVHVFYGQRHHGSPCCSDPVLTPLSNAGNIWAYSGEGQQEHLPRDLSIREETCWLFSSFNESYNLINKLTEHATGTQIIHHARLWPAEFIWGQNTKQNTEFLLIPLLLFWPLTSQ